MSSWESSIEGWKQELAFATTTSENIKALILKLENNITVKPNEVIPLKEMLVHIKSLDALYGEPLPELLQDQAS